MLCGLWPFTIKKRLKMKISDVKTRKDFVKIINRIGLKVGVEVGVCRGLNASWILENSFLRVLYGVENWSVKNCHKCRKETEDVMEKYGDRFVWRVGNSSDEADKFEDNSIHFLYIDGDHRYKSVIKDIRKWYPKVRKGGFFGGHDYVEAKKCGVIRAVDEFFGEIKRDFFLVDQDCKETNTSFWMIK